MFGAEITYNGYPSQCAKGMASRTEALQWLSAKADELAELGILDSGYAFNVIEPQEEDEMEMARRMR